jgi:hypothetical protein
MRTIITALVAAFLALVIAVSGNVIWQNLYCGTPINKCNPLQVEPCERIDAIESQRLEYQRLAELYGTSE